MFNRLFPLLISLDAASSPWHVFSSWTKGSQVNSCRCPINKFKLYIGKATTQFTCLHFCLLVLEMSFGIEQQTFVIQIKVQPNWNLEEHATTEVDHLFDYSVTYFVWIFSVVFKKWAHELPFIDMIFVITCLIMVILEFDATTSVISNNYWQWLKIKNIYESFDIFFHVIHILQTLS